jgi:hypothetical protein
MFHSLYFIWLICVYSLSGLCLWTIQYNWTYCETFFVAFVFGYKLEPFCLLLLCQGWRCKRRFYVVELLIKDFNFTSNEVCDSEGKVVTNKEGLLYLEFRSEQHCNSTNACQFCCGCSTAQLAFQCMDLNLRVHYLPTHAPVRIHSKLRRWSPFIRCVLHK